MTKYIVLHEDGKNVHLADTLTDAKEMLEVEAHNWMREHGYVEQHEADRQLAAREEWLQRIDGLAMDDQARAEAVADQWVPPVVATDHQRRRGRLYKVEGEVDYRFEGGHVIVD